MQRSGTHFRLQVTARFAHSVVIALAGARFLVGAPTLLAQKPNDPRAVIIVDRAIARMGGEAALRAVKGVRMDIMTQWARTNFADHPFADLPSYERNVELRDYTTNAWRNTRDFMGSGSSVDIVADTVGARFLSGAGRPTMVMPLNVAYVDERRQLFAVATERLFLAARDAGGMRMLTDTVIDRVKHARIAATVDGIATTIVVRSTDGLPAFVRYRADETNDFGLAPWGEMEVEYWYSNWARLAPGVLIPRQRDVRRVGRTYKRMSVLTAAFNAPAPADSFAIADSTVAKYLATERRPMWNVPLDSTKILADHFAAFGPWTGTSGAVRIGGKWVLLESGQRDGAAALVQNFFAKRTPESPIGAVIASNGFAGNGGVVFAAAQKIPIYASPGAYPVVRQILGATRATAATTVIGTARWVKIGTDSLWMEPVDAPDSYGSLVVYSPTLKWAYSLLAGRPSTQFELDAALARLRARGFVVESLGGARELRGAAPAAAR